MERAGSTDSLSSGISDTALPLSGSSTSNTNDNDDDNHNDNNSVSLGKRRRRRSTRWKGKKRARTILLPPKSAHAFSSDVLGTLECQICLSLFLQPIITSCGHTFCFTCLSRSLDHNPACPSCRHPVKELGFLPFLPVDVGKGKEKEGGRNRNLALEAILEGPFGPHTEYRLKLIASELPNDLPTPIFIHSLVFPLLPAYISLHEPRHRLLLRRVLASSDRLFGICLPDMSGGAGVGEYGTWMKVVRVSDGEEGGGASAEGGRVWIEALGVGRFKVLKRGTVDGYIVGSLEDVEDLPFDEEEDGREYPSTSLASGTPDDIPSLVRECHGFIDSIRSGSQPWLLQRLDTAFGTMPDSRRVALEKFGWWIAAVLPIDDHEKVRLLRIRSAKTRLRLIVHWITQLRSSWWFSRGCLIM
ncbi:hypothetical protein BT69DRAFT_1264672 [Atractiella rhizophila]|nr:hypothetical protein BT69DRAFT_1264672 [Atractiella rhizophila]